MHFIANELLSGELLTHVLCTLEIHCFSSSNDHLLIPSLPSPHPYCQLSTLIPSPAELYEAFSVYVQMPIPHPPHMKVCSSIFVTIYRQQLGMLKCNWLSF